MKPSGADRATLAAHGASAPREAPGTHSRAALGDASAAGGIHARPATLDRAGIAERIPHQGSMCLLERLLAWTQTDIHCSASNQSSLRHPLRTASGLLAPAAIEYAAQAMALHGALVAHAGSRPAPGYLASVRNVRLHASRLDLVEGELHVRAERLSGDASLVSYRFEVADSSGRPLVDGRATVVLNTPLP